MFALRTYLYLLESIADKYMLKFLAQSKIDLKGKVSGFVFMFDRLFHFLSV